ncbi:MAG TPA: electron transfer flavoprotein subunit beta/FixA family protein [Rhodothermales bacterium]|nr:electron transfer flavoprotein subunit beta/FixA family protein [Rhodothermales bacterium]
MRFCVCIKQVPDVTAPIQVRDGHLVMDAGRVVLNAYDASAVEAALVLTEAHGGTVDVLLIGPERASETVRKALAMGADAGVHLVVPEGTELDSAAVAALLADALAGGGYDAILTGKQAQDTDSGLAGAMLAERLGLPYVTNAVGLAQEGDTLLVTRQGDAGQEMIAAPAPCLVTCSNDMNDPRIPGIKGVMASKKKPVDVRPVGGAPAVQVRTLGFEAIPDRPAGRTLDGEAAEVAGQAVRLLHDEARAL